MVFSTRGQVPTSPILMVRVRLRPLSTVLLVIAWLSACSAEATVAVVANYTRETVEFSLVSTDGKAQRQSLDPLRLVSDSACRQDWRRVRSGRSDSAAQAGRQFGSLLRSPRQETGTDQPSLFIHGRRPGDRARRSRRQGVALHDPRDDPCRRQRARPAKIVGETPEGADGRGLQDFRGLLPRAAGSCGGRHLGVGQYLRRLRPVAARVRSGSQAEPGPAGHRLHQPIPACQRRSPSGGYPRASPLAHSHPRMVAAHQQDRAARGAGTRNRPFPRRNPQRRIPLGDAAEAGRSSLARQEFPHRFRSLEHPGNVPAGRGDGSQADPVVSPGTPTSQGEPASRLPYSRQIDAQGRLGESLYRDARQPAHWPPGTGHQSHRLGRDDEAGRSGNRSGGPAKPYPRSQRRGFSASGRRADGALRPSRGGRGQPTTPQLRPQSVFARDWGSAPTRRACCATPR